jgi:hypothetical protein
MFSPLSLCLCGKPNLHFAFAFFTESKNGRHLTHRFCISSVLGTNDSLLCSYPSVKIASTAFASSRKLLTLYTPLET